MSRWDDLSMAEKAEMMKVAVRNGIYSLSDIREKYNEFAEGRNLYDGKSKSSNKMRKSGATGNTLKSTFLDTLNQSLKEDNRFDSSEFRRLFTELADMESSYRPTITNSIGAKGYFQLMPSNRSSSWGSPTQQFHDMYKLVGNNLDYFNKNLTEKDWKRATELGIDKYGLLAGAHLGGVGNVVKALRGKGNAKDMNGSSVLGYMTKFSQIGKPSSTSTNPIFAQEPPLPVSTAVVNPFVLPAENTTFFPQVTPVEDNYVEVQETTPEQRRAERVRNTFDAINRYNRMMDMISVPNNPAPVYRPKNAPYVVMGLGGPIVEAAMNEYKKGGSIHIKPSHKGRLTELKKRTGKTEAELYNDGNPAHKRMVVFARNARKWEHGLGGNLFDGTTEDSQQMITTHKPYYDRDGMLLYNRTLPETVIIPDSQLSPAERNYRERQRQRNLPDYAERKDRETTSRQVAQAQKEWENSFEKQALDYGQAIASGIGMGADMVSHLPIYSSLKGARVLSEARTPTDYIEGGLWLAPITSATYQGIKPYAKKAATEAAIAWNLRNPEISNVFSDLHPVTKKAEINTSTNKPVFIRWGNDERFAVQPSAEVYNDIINQLKDARSYRTSSGYKELVNRFTKESRDKGIDFSESLFDGNNKSLSKLTVSNREAGHLGEYYPSTNRIDLDLSQIGDIPVSFHEGIHWQRVGAPADRIGPKFEKWLEARKAGDPNEAQLFEEFRNSTEYERYYQRKAADKAIQDKVEEALYPSADETLRNRGELQAYGLEAGKAIGIKPFSEYPGMIDALTAIEKARKYSPQLRDIKSGGEENVKRFWDILTGNYIPSTVIGAFGINSYLNK